MVDRRKRVTLGRNSGPHASASANRGSKMKDLLSDSDESESITKKQRSNDKPMNFGNFVVQACEYDYPRIGHVPATYYRSVIADMQVREKDGREILDVFYDIEDSYGREYHILQSYPKDSRPFKQLAAALAAAGVPNGATADAGIGVCEVINLDYVSKKSDFGSIIERKPYVAPPDSDDQEEDYEQLEDED